MERSIAARKGARLRRLTCCFVVLLASVATTFAYTKPVSYHKYTLVCSGGNPPTCTNHDRRPHCFQ